MIAKEHQNKKESKIWAKLQQMDQRWTRETIREIRGSKKKKQGEWMQVMEMRAVALAGQ